MEKDRCICLMMNVLKKQIRFRPVLRKFFLKQRFHFLQMSIYLSTANSFRVFINTLERSDFTQGSILKKMIPFMMPILGALILQAAYGAVDLLVVGRFGTTAGLSAVSTGSQILNLVTFVITQLAMGITVLIARYIGEKHTSQIGELLGGATTVFTMTAAI